jgi:hypothetical protein
MLPSRIFSAKPDFNECIARIYAWYGQSILDRVPVRFHHHNVEYEKHRVVKGPWKTAEARWLDVEFQVRTFVESLAGAQFLGETFPVFWPNLSAVAYNLFLGQKHEFDDVTAWTHPCVQDLDNLPELKIQKDKPYFKTIEALTVRALDLAEGRFMVGYTDMYAGIDCTAGLRGTEPMCIDLIENPDGIKRLIDVAFTEYAEIYSRFDAKLKRHGQLSVTWMNLPSFESFNVLACDFAANVSTDHFDEFCMPVLRREAECFVHNVFHMDGKGVAKNLDSILTLPNVAAIQWVQGYGVDQPILQWVPMIKKIQAAGKSVIVDLAPTELDAFMKQVDPAGILLWINAEPKDQADILKKVKHW